MLQLPAKLTFEFASDVLRAGLKTIASGQQQIDFSGVTSVDSSAIGLLLAWQRAAAKRNAVLQFINLPASLQSLASLYGVDDLLAAHLNHRHHQPVASSGSLETRHQ